MRRVPHPLMVITTTTNKGDSAGLLVSSFNTVTLRPKPLVSFNIRLPSSTYDAISSSGSFTATAIWSTETADAYIKRMHAGSLQYQGLDSQSQGPASVLSGGLFKFDCEWLREKSTEVGDHVIMVGRVLRHQSGPAMNESKSPLVYVNGRYQSTSPAADFEL